MRKIGWLAAIAVGVPAGARAVPDGSAIVARNIFNSRPSRQFSETGPRATRLSLELVSTMVVPDDERWSTAVIRDVSAARARPELYRRGSLVGSAVVARVVERRVYLVVDGRVEYLDFAREPPPGVAAAADPLRCQGDRCRIDRKELERTLAQPAALATGVRAVPTAGGLRLDWIQPESPLSRIGLRSGDLVRAVNGLEAATPDQWLAIYSRLRNANRVQLTIVRRGATMTLDYAIE